MTFNANGGTGTMATESSTTAQSLTSNAFSYSGYVFSGWNTIANGSGTAYANGATYPFTASTTLYAQWTALPTYTVTFNANGGSGTMTPETSDVAEPLSANTFTNGTETFVSWNTNANGSGTAYANGASYPFTASTTLYAQWTTNTAPSITQQPTNQSVNLDSTATFTAAASGTPAPSVLWQVSTNGGTTWSSIPGATSDSYSVRALTTGYEYEAVFTNSVRSVTTEPAQLVALGYSGNWAGYILTNSTFSTVSGSWTVPQVTCTSPSALYASEWIGIDGDSDNYVIQDGTSTDCNGTTPVYSAWYEFYGDNNVNGGYAVDLPSGSHPVAPGDVMTAEVSYIGGAWDFTLDDTTAHWTFSTSAPEPSPPPTQSSAEWIVEAPEECNESGDCSESSLANFGTVTFTNSSATANGTATSLVSPSGVAEIDEPSTTILMLPGPLSNAGTAFTVTWKSTS
ncbi:MAG: G1 family glutamic endopeptidase [Acidimicrobiales bacterium]